jgi:hypothetical protein
MRIRVAVLALVPSLALAPAWRAHVATPPARAHHALAYDPVARRVVLAGGSTPRDSGRSFEFFDDVWAFDGRAWSSVARSGDRLSGIGLAFDARRGRLISLGGYDGSARGDLRVLEPSGWRTIATYDTLRVAEPGVAYDTRRGRLVVFGGSPGRGQANGDTRELDGDRWHRVDVAGPPPRQAHVMVFDERRGRVVVFGGMAVAPAGQRPPPLGDTWEYDGARWRRLDVASPSPRMAAGATYDAKRGLVLVFGGSGADGMLGDTWGWDGTSWRRLAERGPGARVMGQLAYDAARDRTVMFGGRRGWPNGDLADTWEWDGSTWTELHP